MIDIKDLPAAWTTSLRRVRELFPDSLLAGGALRDLENGRRVKDVDIFAPNCADLEQATEHVKKLANAPFKCLSSENRVGPDGRVYAEWAANDVLAIFDIQSEEMDYQLICLKCGPEAIVKRIDFGLCRISTDGQTIHRTEEYNTDCLNETFTLHRCDDTSQYDRSVRRHERLVEKYTDWPMKVAPHLLCECGQAPKFEGCFCGF